MGMTCVVHQFDAREGGSFRASLTYDAPAAAGKTTAHADTYHGHFARLVPDEQVVEVLEFETSDPFLLGKMTLTTTLTDAGDGTDVVYHVPGAAPGRVGRRQRDRHADGARQARRPGRARLQQLIGVTGSLVRQTRCLVAAGR